MLQHVSATLLAILIVVARSSCAPTTKEADKNPPPGQYDYGKYDEVYDQRQNGSENYKVDVNGVVLVYAPPQSLLSTIAFLLDPGLLNGDLEELDNLLKPQKPQEPQESPVVHPERPSSSTTTSLPPTTIGEDVLVAGNETNTPKHVVVKRRYRLPQVIRSLLGRRRRRSH